ncbi:MAG: LytTR family DNA-binding domain-containing protein [Clostridium sp.]
MKTAVCDDRPEDRETIGKHLMDYAVKNKIENELSFYESGEELLLALKKTSFQIIFMDIYMHELNGIDVAREIRRYDKSVQIIFITNSPDHAISSYEVHALYYIMKPVSYSKIEKVLSLCQFETVQAGRQIEVPVEKVLTPVKLSEIIYADVFNKRLTLHTTYGVMDTRMSLENFETLLGGVPFLRCHRSFVVNMDFIADIEEDAFLLTNGECVPISRPSKTSAVKTYNEYVFSSMRKRLC